MVTCTHTGTLICVYHNIIDVKQEKKQVTRVNSTIDSELEKEFREVANKKFKYKKGSIQFGLEEAIDEWIKQQRKKGIK